MLSSVLGVLGIWGWVTSLALNYDFVFVTFNYAVLSLNKDQEKTSTIFSESCFKIFDMQMLLGIEFSQDNLLFNIKKRVK